MKWWLIVFIFVIISAGLASIIQADVVIPQLVVNNGVVVPEDGKPRLATSTAAVAAPITLVFGGDVMLSRVVGQKMVKYKNFDWPFEKIAPLFSNADGAIVNLESPFSKTGKHFVPTGSFAFDADPQALGGLKKAGVDVVTLANNHFGNQGQQGMKDTFSLLRENDIAYVGAGTSTESAHTEFVKTFGDMRVAFLGYAYPDTEYVASNSSAGIASMNVGQMKVDVARAKTKADIVVVLMHAGIEYTATPNKQQKDFAHAAIDAGADIIVGHHPHWVQTVEVYKNKPIMYSLGNLIFDQMWSTETQQGAVATVVFDHKKIQKVTITPIHIADYGQPDIVRGEKERTTILSRMGMATSTLYLP